MSLDLFLMMGRNGDTNPVRLNRAFAVREWFVACIGVPENGQCQLKVTKPLLSELLESCNTILADPSQAESLIPINTNNFDPNQAYNDEYFDQIEETKKQLDHLFKIWNGRKPLYYLEWY